MAYISPVDSSCNWQDCREAGRAACCSRSGASLQEDVP